MTKQTLPQTWVGCYKLQVQNNEFCNSPHLFQTSVQFPIGKNQLIPLVIANNQKNAAEAAMNDESTLYSDLTGANPINSFSFSIYVQLQNCESTTKARLSISYRTSRYDRNIPYRPTIRYTRPPCFVPEKIPVVPANFGQYRPVQKKVFFFFFFKFCNF